MSATGTEEEYSLSGETIKKVSLKCNKLIVTCHSTHIVTGRVPYHTLVLYAKHTSVVLCQYQRQSMLLLCNSAAIWRENHSTERQLPIHGQDTLCYVNMPLLSSTLLSSTLLSSPLLLSTLLSSPLLVTLVVVKSECTKK